MEVLTYEIIGMFQAVASLAADVQRQAGPMKALTFLLHCSEMACNSVPSSQEVSFQMKRSWTFARRLTSLFIVSTASEMADA